MTIGCIKITTVTVSDTQFLLETSITNATIYNGQRVRLCVHANIPATSTVVPVFLVINGENIPLMDSIGNTLQSDQVRNCYCYCGVFGTEPLHLKLNTVTAKSQATPISTVPSATTEPAGAAAVEGDIDEFIWSE